MTIIDDIKRDLDAGTPGPWRGPEDFESYDFCVIGSDDLPVCQVHGRLLDCGPADLSRIARVPDMEAALLASEKMVMAAKEAWMMMKQNEAAAALGEAIHEYEKAIGKIGPT